MKNFHFRTTPNRVSTKDFAYFVIKQRIIEGDLQPNESVIEEELSTELGISRTPLREALQRLEMDNLVVRKSNGRLKIAPVSIKEVEEIFIVRGSLEAIAVVQATENATESDIRNLSNIAYLLNESIKDGSIDDILYYGSQFHNYIYELSGNNTVGKILSQLNDHIHRYRRLVPSQKIDTMTEEGEEHQIILKYMSKKDKEGAKKAMQRHIQNSLESAKTALRKYISET